MNDDRFAYNNRAYEVGQLGSDGRYMYYLGTVDGKPVMVSSPSSNICKESLKMFQQDILRQAKQDKLKERLRKKLEAKNNHE